MHTMKNKETTLSCPSCGSQLKIPSDRIVVRARCQKCGEVITPDKIELPAKKPAPPPVPHGQGKNRRKGSARRPPKKSALHSAKEKSIREIPPSKSRKSLIPVLASILALAVILWAIFFQLLPKEKQRREREEEQKRKIADRRKKEEEERAKADKEFEKVLAALKKPEKKGGTGSEEKESGFKKKILRKDYTIEDLPHLETTEEPVRKRIDGLIETLIKLELTRESLEAGEELKKIGVPAIPRLLGKLSHLDMTAENDVLQGKLVTQVLADMANIDDPHRIIFPTGFDPITVKDRIRVIQIWFGWWSINKYELLGIEPE